MRDVGQRGTGLLFLLDGQSLERAKEAAGVGAGRPGWSPWRIQWATGVRRGTPAGYLEADGLDVGGHGDGN